MTKYKGFFGRKARRRCPHDNMIGMYGDMINSVGGWRLFCDDCHKLLDGPVSLSKENVEKAKKLDRSAAELSQQQSRDYWQTVEKYARVLREVKALADHHDDYCCSKGCVGPGMCISGAGTKTDLDITNGEINLSIFKYADKCEEKCNCSSEPYLTALEKVNDGSI